MAALDMTLTHTNVNSGTPVYLFGADIKYIWKNLIRADAMQGLHDISEVEYAGFENPIIMITGVIDVNSSQSNIITQSLLMDFAQCCDGTNNLVLTVYTEGEGTGTYLKGRPTAGYSVGGTYIDNLKVVIKDFSISFGVPESKEGRIWNYTIELVETA